MNSSVMDRIREGCEVGFFGVGRSNLSLLGCLPLENCRVTLRSEQRIDRKSIPRGIRVARILDSKEAFSDVREEILVLSPSVRRERAEIASLEGVTLTSDLELFLESNDKPIFAVSGSDGKSTTSTLANMLLGDSLLVGNVGEPMTAKLGKGERYVAELSSFMLAYAAVPSQRACLTNITPNHLDWHSSFAQYRDTKLALLESAREWVVNADDGILMQYAKSHEAFGLVSEQMSFDELKGAAKLIITRSRRGIERNGELILPYSDVSLKERHNIKNLMTAIALTDGYANADTIRRVAREFTGLSHRCERFLRIDGVEYINSSIDSTPARTAITLESLGKKVLLLLGGRSKGVGYDALVPCAKKYVKKAFIFGENREEIYAAIKDHVKCEICENMEDAAKRAAALSEYSDTVLLSPASTSYDAFSSFEERGNTFKKLIKDITCKL